MATINGTNGDDREDHALRGTVDSDLYRGLRGDDWFYVGLGDDSIEGGQGFDVVIYEWGTLDWVKINLTNFSRYGLAAQTVLKSNGQIDKLSSIEGIHGTEGNDLILLSGGGYTFDGDGDDLIYIYDASSVYLGLGNDRVIGNGSAWLHLDNPADPFAENGVTIALSGNGVGRIFDDTAGTVDVFRGIYGVSGTFLNDRVFGASGNDRFYGLDGSDFLSGGAGDDLLDGGDGDDTLEGGSGENLLLGGEGDDTYIFSYDGMTRIEDTSGLNVLRIEATSSAFFKELMRDGDSLILRSTNGSELIYEDISGLVGINWVPPFDEHDEYFIAMEDLYIGTSEDDDLISLSQGYSEMYGGGGNDHLYAQNGGAWMTGDGGNDTLNGGEGDDGLHGDYRADDYGDDVLFGNGGNDRLYGEDGNDWLEGGSGDDFLFGGRGNDTINDGAGTDYIDGGDGVDTFQRNLSDDYEDYSFVPVVNLALGKMYAVGYEDEFDTIINIENVILTGRFDDIVWGGGENNTLSTGEGNDTLNGEAGADTLIGGAGNDSLIGGAGKDTLKGDAGNDIFIFNSMQESGITAAASDVITDFVKGQDKIDLSAIDAFASTSANDTFIWRGTLKFNSTTQGEVRYQKFDVAGTANDHTMIWIDNDKDTGVEMAIRLTGLHDLTASDFVL